MQYYCIKREQCFLYLWKFMETVKALLLSFPIQASKMGIFSILQKILINLCSGIFQVYL